MEFLPMTQLPLIFKSFTFDLDYFKPNYSKQSLIEFCSNTNYAMFYYEIYYYYRIIMFKKQKTRDINEVRDLLSDFFQYKDSFILNYNKVMNDIEHYKKSLDLIMDFYMRYKYDFNQMEELAMDLFYYFNNGKMVFTDQYLLIWRRYNYIKKTDYKKIKSIKKRKPANKIKKYNINTFVENILLNKNVNIQIRIFWGLLTINEREHFIDFYLFKNNYEYIEQRIKKIKYKKIALEIKEDIEEMVKTTLYENIFMPDIKMLVNYEDATELN